MARTNALVEQFGKLPAGMSKADIEVVLEFLYGAFDKKAAKQVQIFHPYMDVDEPPSLTIADFCKWLREVAA